LLERKGEPSALITTRGFRHLLHIGNQSRPKIFDLAINAPEVLYSEVVEVDERVTLVGYTAGGAEGVGDRDLTEDGVVKGITGEWVRIMRKPNLKKVEAQLREIYDKGIRSVAVCFLHSFTFPDHEKIVGDLCASIGFTNITLSSALTPTIKIVPRGSSATLDAYLTPCIQRYINTFFSGFDEGIRDPSRLKVEFMQSDGGLAAVNDFSGFRAILSGPAGGVVGYGLTSYEEGGRAVIGFDMGGTSTDVSRYAGRFEHVFETITAGIPIQAPQLDIHTVAAGGGSCLVFRNGLMFVGPESASADPGPTCYRKGGPLTITDANLFLGRLIPDFFPKIFGKSEREPLDVDATRIAFESVASDINAFLGAQSSSSSMNIDEIVYGFITVANESMCRPIRALTQGKGFDTADHILASFGGAGGQHACAIARSLGISQILIHRYSSVLSAVGLSLADVVHEEQEPSAVVLASAVLPHIQARSQELTSRCVAVLTRQGFTAESITCEVHLNLRYQGTDTAIMTLASPTGIPSAADFSSRFAVAHHQEFGFTLPDRDIIVDDIRVRATGHTATGGPATARSTIHAELRSLARTPPPPDRVAATANTYWEGGRRATPVYLLGVLEIGNEVVGPAIIVDDTATILVEPGCAATIASDHIVITVGSGERRAVGVELDPVQLSVFAHRFMSIAEQMGRTLQKTSISTNIKERLDFSCALFGPDGGLVANAPHIPVHLGSMQEAVRWQMNHLKDNLKEGDAILTNHPAAGGSHLPDMTVITPVFSNGKPVFFVASRGHHADIGGIQPGSMPPTSRELYQEGAAIKSFKIVEAGTFNEEGIVRILVDEPAKFPGCSGSRCLKDNISDLKGRMCAMTWKLC
ncbi:5-oxoprolinase-like protein, partial [Blyttiomyces helicus]